LKKDEQLVKKISLVVISSILIGLTTTLLIFYFANPQIKNIYQHGESIGIGYNEIFATLSNPTAIAADSTGNVYVIDAGSNRVQKFTTDGTFLKEWEIQRTRASQLFPSGIAADNTGSVYVIDAGSNRVQKFTTDGIFVKEWDIN
jgi:DNA-binding beta-propeller fold protein YncE